MNPTWTSNVHGIPTSNNHYSERTMYRATRLAYRKSYSSQYLTAMLSILCLSTGCGFDPASAEFDERRYIELQKANCHEVASAGASKLINKTPEKSEVILERCQSLQHLTLEQYRLAAEYARQHEGKWDIAAALGAPSLATEPTPSTEP